MSLVNSDKHLRETTLTLKTAFYEFFSLVHGFLALSWVPLCHDYLVSSPAGVELSCLVPAASPGAVCACKTVIAVQVC